MITMIAAGLWHGVSFLFLAWGVVHGIALIVHKTCLPWLKRLPHKTVTTAVSWFIFYIFLLFSWILFRAPGHEQAFDIIQRIFTDFSFSTVIPFFTTRPLLSCMLIVGYLLLTVGQQTYRVLERMFIMSPWLLKLLLVMFVVQLLLNMHATGIQPFIYERF